MDYKPLLDYRHSLEGMSPKEKEMQQALGLYRNWIVIVEDYAEFLRCQKRKELRDDFQLKTYRIGDNSYLIYVVVGAVSEKDAQCQVHQSNLFTKNNFRIIKAWQNDKAAALYIKQYQEQRRWRWHHICNLGDERIYIISHA